MTNQQLADQLLAQWQLLWWAKPADRIRIIDQVKADLEYEEQLSLVSEEMSSCVNSISTSASPSSFSDHF